MKKLLVTIIAALIVISGFVLSLDTAPPKSAELDDAVNRAVSNAVNSFLGGSLSPQAVKRAKSGVETKVLANPEEFVSDVKILAGLTGQKGGQPRVEVSLSHAAMRGALLEVIPPRSLVFAVTGSKGNKKIPESTVSTHFVSALEGYKHNFKVIAPGELERLFATHSDLRKALRAPGKARELGLSVLAELVCIGNVNIEADASSIKGVYAGTAEADLRLIDCKTAEVLAAVTVDFRDKIPAMKREAEERAEKIIYKKAVEALLKKTATLQKRTTAIRLRCSLGPIYTAFLRSYSSHSFGTIRVKNSGNEPVGPLTVGLVFDRGLLLEPFRVEIPSLGPGAGKEIPVSGKFATRMLSVQSQEIGAEIFVRRLGGEKLDEMKRAVLVHKMNVFSWKEPNAIAAYVDPDDNSLKTVLAGVWHYFPEQTVPTYEMSFAASVYSALCSLRLNYRRDAYSPVFTSASTLVHDRVNFPGETLAEGAGDCDDLTVLFSSLLESAGVRSGIIVCSDHVLPAFETGIAQKDLAVKIFGKEGIFFRNGKVWWPVEATAMTRGEPFLSAWRSAWTSVGLLNRGDAQFVDIQDAWNTWQPAERLNNNVTYNVKVPFKAIPAELKSLENFIDLRLTKEVDGKNSGRLPMEKLSRLGRLYALCGMYGKARGYFEKAAEETNSFEMHFNLGESIMLGGYDPGNLKKAVKEFETALKLVPKLDIPSRSRTLLHLAIAQRLSGNIQAEQEVLAKACVIDNNIKKKYESLFVSSTKGGRKNNHLREFLLKSFQ